MAGPHLKKIWFVALLVAAAAAKLWLIWPLEIHGTRNYYDELCYLRAARDWYWGAKYSFTAFVRPPAYPLWIATSHFLGVPLRISAELLFLAGYAVLTFGLRLSGVSRSIAAAAFVLAIFHPVSIHLHSLVLSDCFYAALLPMFVGGLLIMLALPKMRHAGWTGLVLVALWHTREETLLLSGAVILLVGLFLARHSRGSPDATLRMHWKPLGMLAGVLILGILVINTANYRTFRGFAKSELFAPEIARLYRALMEIKPSQPQRFVPISREARTLAYEVSPAFAALRPDFEGKVAASWEYEARVHHGIEGEITGGWSIWALRDAAAKAGFHKKPRETVKFYRAAADEIERALESGSVPRRRIYSIALIPGWTDALKDYPKSLRRVAGLYLAEYRPILERDAPGLTERELRRYDVCLRRPAESSSPGAARSAVMETLAVGYPRVFVALVFSAGAGLALWLVVLALRFQAKGSFALDPALLLIGTTIAARFALFVFLDATAFPAGKEVRYQFPVMPLASVFLVLVIAAAIGRLRTVLSRSSGAAG